LTSFSHKIAKFLCVARCYLHDRNVLQLSTVHNLMNRIILQYFWLTCLCTHVESIKNVISNITVDCVFRVLRRRKISLTRSRSSLVQVIMTFVSCWLYFRRLACRQYIKNFNFFMFLPRCFSRIIYHLGDCAVNKGRSGSFIDAWIGSIPCFCI